MGTNIVVVGGYGVVGREIVSVLSRRYPERVVVAGRRFDEAAKFCATIGRGTVPSAIDAGNEKSFGPVLEGVGSIVCCIDQPERLLLRAAVERGLAYTDIAPHLVSFEGREELAQRAEQTGARIVLGAGLSPGISSVLAKTGADKVGPVDSIDSSVLLGIGDAFGPASLSFILKEVQLPFSIVVSGRKQRAVAFGGSRRVQFPEPLGTRRAYLFPFSDAVGYPRTLGAKTARAWLALDPPWLGTLSRCVLDLGGRRLLSRSGFAQANRAGLDRVKRAYAGRDHFALSLEVRGKRGLSLLSLVGTNQSRATGVGAAEIARSLIDGEVDRAGVWFAEEVIPAQAFLERLGAHGLQVVSRHVAISRRGA